ncbi:uncharacterized protein LOC130672847 [Microplitis mediator]|uniref:uncharacterized protein LOC130672847 n=1 Tax=Microplitis mediator TaxID=375433 RepID=UPI00255258EE|nr:uncharacterized protein LOC130672847 [Microplitis mediator]
MGSHKKRSRSRDRSSERTSKRLRKLEDRMEEIVTGFAVIKEAILARDAPVLVTPETTASNSGDNVAQVKDSVSNQGDDLEETWTTDQDPRIDDTEVQINNTTDGGEAPAKIVEELTKPDVVETPWELDEDGLRIFGEEHVREEPELVLHSSVATRWKKYLSEGLKKEVKDSLMEKYPRKGKLSFEPPILNEEVTVNLKDSALKRDKYFGATQKLAGSALAALASVIESLAPLRDPENVKRLEQVWDASKLLIEIHRSQTVARKACILPTLSKQWATALEKRVTDSYLFGEKLVDKVKEIKAIGLVESEEVSDSGEREIINSEKTTDFQIPIETIELPEVEPISKTKPANSEPLAPQDLLSTIQRMVGARVGIHPIRNDRLLSIGAIIEAEEVLGQFLSPFFLVPKSDGQQRFILNLKELNNFIDAEHFKLEDLRSACSLLEQGIFMGTIDLKDAYFLISVWKPHRKFLRFIFNGKIFEFVCLPFGLCTCPLTFTKLLKPVINYLRSKGWLSVVYLDDFLCLGHSVNDCSENLTQTIELLERLGFIVNYDKSKLVPERRCKYLGFILNSVSMRVELPLEKEIMVRKQIEILKRKRMMKIRDFAKVVGSVVACCPAVEYSLLHCRSFERAKIQALDKSEGCFDAIMLVPKFTLIDWDWWLKALPNASRKVRNNRYERTIYSDASLSGWGAFCNDESANGLWNQEERGLHINHLELKAALLALKCFAVDLKDTDILLMVDNTTTLAYINRMGGVRYSGLHGLACELWNWCEARQLWVYATYIPSKENVEADRSSRIDNSDAEWELADYAFENIMNKFGKFEIDLFASRINTKCAVYCSWKRDPGAIAFDAFTISWSDWMFYAFPPFSMITKVIKKIKDDKAEGVLVVPHWPTQVTSTSFGIETYPGCRQVVSQALSMKVGKILKFLSERFSGGVGYSTLNSARAALSLISSEDVTNNQLISRFLKGSSKIRPSLPKYESTWDVDPVLSKLATWFPLKELALKELSMKLVLLLALGTAHRSQTLALIKISNISVSENGIEIRISDRIKTSRPGAPQPVFEIPFFRDKPELCIAQTLNHYMAVTKNLRGSIDSLFVSFNKPHKAVKSETISRWIRSTLVSLGVDQKFTAHSTRHASTSKAFERGVSIEEIKKVAGWSPSSKVFADSYQQPIIINSNKFATSVLSPSTTG